MDRRGSSEFDFWSVAEGGRARRLHPGDPGVLTGDPNPSARFVGVSGEPKGPAAGPASAGTLEGWFDWRAASR